ncbi:MAG TPA: hypothetical protein VG963_14485 [Polyangiaceae bacterium]|nr:hypothetical protein [Polyangiaceae bacterium]
MAAPDLDQFDAESDPSSSEEAARPFLPKALVGLDAGWLFLLVGIVTLATTIIIPAQEDLKQADWQRDKAVAVERHRHERVKRYGDYLAAVNRGDECVVLSLLATQLNKSPADRVPLDPPNDPSTTSASVFPGLEPEPFHEPPPPDAGIQPSILQRWTTSDRDRVWLLAGGIMCTLIGLLPGAKAAKR